MRREDIVWLMVKGAGVWLLVTGVERLPTAVAMMFDPQARWGSTYIEPWISSVGPLLVGGLLLFANEGRWLRAVNDGREPAPIETEVPTEGARAGTMTRQDWLWVGLKIVGAWVVAVSLVYLASYWSMVGLSGGRFGMWTTLVGAACHTAFGLWLLFGNQIWRWASRA